MDGGEGASAEGQEPGLGVGMTPMGESEAGVVWVRSGMRGSAAGDRVWRAGRRRGLRRLADVNIERTRFSDVDGGAEQSNQKKARVTLVDGGEEGSEWSDGSRVGAVGTTGGSEHGSAGSSVLAAETMEGTIEAAHKGRGRYAVGSRWHEAVLIEMLRALGSPSLEWRYGDG